MNDSLIKTVEIPSVLNRMTDGKVLGSYFFPEEVLKANLNPLTINIIDNENFVNPQAANLELFLSHSQNINSMSAMAANTIYIVANATSLVAQTQYFIKHTGRLSGNIKIGTPDSMERDREVPHLVTLSSMGQANSYVKYIETGNFDSTEVDELYASLFVNLSANVSTLNTYYTQISSNLEILGSGEGMSIQSYLTIQDAKNIANDLYIIESYIRDCRLTDEEKYNILIKNSMKYTFNMSATINNAQQQIVNQAFTNF